METLQKIKNDWLLKLKTAKNDHEKHVILRRIQKIDDEIEKNSYCSQESENQISESTQTASEEKIFYFSQKLNENFVWDTAQCVAVFDSGPVYTEIEIRDLHRDDNVDNIMLRCIHQIKQVFPQTRYKETVETVVINQQEDELDLLFKNLKG